MKRDMDEALGIVFGTLLGFCVWVIAIALVVTAFSGGKP